MKSISQQQRAIHVWKTKTNKKKMHVISVSKKGNFVNKYVPID